MKPAEKALFLRIFDPLRKAAIGLFAFSAGINILMLASPIYMYQIYDRVMTTRHLDTLVALSLMMLVAVFVQAVLEATRGVVFSRCGVWLERTLGPQALEKSIELSCRAGSVKSAQALRDVMTLRGLMSSGVAPFFDLPWIPLFYLVITLVHPLIGLLVLGGSAVVFAIAVINERLTAAKSKHINTAALSGIEQADAIIRNSDTVKAMGMLPAMLKQRAATTRETRAEQQAVGDISAAISASGRFARYVLQSSVLTLAAYLAIKGEVSPGGVGAVWMISSRAISPVEQLISSWRAIFNARFAWRRLTELFDRVPDAPASMNLPRPRGQLTAERLVWTPPNSNVPIVKGVAFNIEPGESVGLIGPSGAGKTSLVRLLIGSHYPTGGTVRLDGADITQINAGDRSKYFGYLSQDVELFPGTIRDNVSRFQEASDEDVIAAAQRVGAHELILALPQGYETVIGPGAIPLSGGQRQRIGLAAALFGDPALIVLDEPGSSLDSAGEAALNATLMQLKKRGVTVIIVTQRISNVALVDRLMLFQDGRIEAFGPRDQVLQKLRAPAAVADLRQGARAG